MKIAALTDKGRVRPENEDAIYVCADRYPYLLIVADGMGGHMAGEVASSKTIELMVEKIERAGAENVTAGELCAMVEETSREIWRMSIDDPARHNMGTTLMLAILRDNSLIAVHVGDSRAYIFHEGKLSQLTSDHSYVQLLLDRGELTKKEAAVYPFRNIITRAVGMENVVCEANEASFGEGDMLLLCSDGLSGELSGEAIEGILAGEGTVDEKAQRLLDGALAAGGRDNISVILAGSDKGAEL